MSLEALVYARLSGDATLSQLTGGRIYPTVPAENAEALPVLTYTVSGTEPKLNLSGPSGLTRYGVDVECWALDVSEVVAVQAAVASLLHGWRDLPSVHGSFMTNQATQAEDPGHHGTQSFSVWAAA